MKVIKYREMQLTETEAQDLARCEVVIDRTIDATKEALEALREVRDKQLYKGQFGNFQEYLIVRWELSRSRAYQLIDSIEVNANLSTMVDKPLGERQTRELTGLKPEEQRQAYQAAQEDAKATGEPVTAKKIKAAVSKLKAPPVVDVEPEEERPKIQQPLSGIEKLAADHNSAFNKALEHLTKAIEKMASEYPGATEQKAIADTLEIEAVEIRGKLGKE